MKQQVERARYGVQRAERRYRAVDPDNRLVARGLEAEWEGCLRALEAAEAELTSRERHAPEALTSRRRQAILALGADVERVWSAPTTSDRDRKELLRTVLEEVIIAVERDEGHRTLGAPVARRPHHRPRRQPPPKQAAVRTEEDTLGLVRRLAVHYPDAVIAGVLNRQGRRTATGLRFTANRVNGLRTHWGIPRCERRPEDQAAGELVSVYEAARILDVAPSTLHRWVNDGFVIGEQVTPGAPWRIRMTAELRAVFVSDAPEGFVPMFEAMRRLGVSRQTVLQRVKRGELKAVHVRRGRQKGLRIQLPASSMPLFETKPSARG